jgi:putative N-acetyltransferase (TIGR04045 family)
MSTLHAASSFGSSSAWCELESHVECGFRIQWASDPWMDRQAHALRRQVFCGEQGLFHGDDLDDIDRHEPSVRNLVALSCLAGQADEVVGTVRIHRAAPGTWWGSRLAVRHAWRQHRGLGSTLVRLAVCSAQAFDCDEFLGHIQAQNVPLFERLGWRALEEREIHGTPHALMRADLDRYPPCPTPYAGFMLTGGLSS